jgi:hypothetical protein
MGLSSKQPTAKRTNLLMFLQVLRTLETLLALLAGVGLERDVDSDMASDVVSLGGLCGAGSPRAGEAEVVCALAADVLFAKMLVEIARVEEYVGTIDPLARQLLHGA